MELALQVVCEAESPVQAKVIEKHLGPDAPVLEEDVAKAELKVFRALEYIDESDELNVDGTLITAIWTLGGDPWEETEEYLKALDKSGVQKLLAYVWADEFEEMFIMVKGKMTCFKQWDRDEFTDFEGDTDQEFGYLKLLQKQYL